MKSGSPPVTECESCGNAMPFYPTPELRFPVPAGERNEYEYEEKSYCLCSECRRKIADWVEGCSEDEVRVDPVGFDKAVAELERHSEEVERLAAKLERLQTNNGGGSDE